MPWRNRLDRQQVTVLKIIGGMLAAGVILSVLAGSAMLLLSEDSLSPLPPAAADLSTFDRLYLRGYLRLNAGRLHAPSASADGVFEVYAGETATQICARLKDEGWVPDAALMCNYLRYTGGDRLIGSGLFLIRLGQSPAQIADGMSSGESRIRLMAVFAGWRIEEIAEALPIQGIPMAPGDFFNAAAGRPGADQLSSLYAEIPSWATLEGFLFPAEYRVLPGERADQLVERMALAFVQSLPQGWVEAIRARGLTIYQAVTLASIIQREAVLEEEMPLIASLFYNRMAQGWRLQSDPTVQYAVGFQSDRGGWWPSPLLDSDLSLDSPYNTYIYMGLPPGPISNPGLQALQAVANPADTSYLFFRAACDGSGRHNFAETYTQHLANAC